MKPIGCTQRITSRFFSLKAMIEMDRIDYYTPFRMRYKLDKELSEKENDNTIIHHRGEKKTIQTSSVEFHVDEIDMIKMFLSIVGETKGIEEVWFGDMNITDAYEYIKMKNNG